MTRLTHRTRLLNRARHRIEEDIQAAMLSEFRWLWRQLYPKLRALRIKREGKVAKRRLIKQIDTSTLWAEFQRRMSEKIGAIIEAASGLLAQTESDFWQRRGKDIAINPADIARRYETDLGTQIRNIGETTRQQVSQDVIEWYNTPGATLQSLSDKVKGQVSESRANTIAINEAGLLSSAIQEETMDRLGIEAWWWQSMRDEIVCIKSLIGPDGRTYNGCRELHGKQFQRGQNMPPKGSHIGCRCNAVPIVPT